MPHPQEVELRDRLREFLSDATDPLGIGREYRGPVVHEPESGSQVEFFYHNDWADEGDWDDDEVLDEGGEDEDVSGDEDESDLTPYIRFGWPVGGKRERALAKRLDVPPPKRIRQKNPFTKKTFVAYSLAEREVEGVEDALEVCLTVLREVYQIPDDRWLWITDVPEYDQWPSPLPKPGVWPPEGR